MKGLNNSYRPLRTDEWRVYKLEWETDAETLKKRVTYSWNGWSTSLRFRPGVQQATKYCMYTEYLGLLTYLLTPWCRVLLEKLTGLKLVKKFPAFYGTRRFITAFTSFRHPSLSWASPIQSPYPQPTSWRSILILSTHLRLGLPSGLFPTGFPTRTYVLTYYME